ncbi:hypothetical protein [Streptomyces sp. SID2888]|uniref:hypothetical protein n=1 Tax=Streptomyces sp. SID2888 TaxID=2690256 RepID=UPI001371A7C6|nr:hypothetical protein [Streptomyces sp. SID2888]
MSVTAFAPETEARLARARRVADAVLFEGCPLHPSRAATARNRLHPQFGVLVPPAWNPDGEAYDFQHTECLMEARKGAGLAVELRFLRVRRRTVQPADPGAAATGAAEPGAGGRAPGPRDEGTEERVEAVVAVDELIGGDEVTIAFTRPAGEERAPLPDEDGRAGGRLIHRQEEISGVLRLSARLLDGPFRLMRLTAVVENTTAWTPPDGRAADRDAALPYSLVATHLLMGLSDGAFLSMAHPPEWAKDAIAACRNLHTWPVLVGEPGRADVVLSSPVILEDHPSAVPGGPAAPYRTTGEPPAPDGTEPPEWREPVDGIAPGALPGRVVVDGRTVAAGSRVRLDPGLRRTDVQDLFLRGRIATVESVLNDVDGSVHLAVTVDDDPGADIRRDQGVFLYFRPDEITPLEDGA